jgi:LPXTG-site transpeptidase (sortase) family protein
MIKKIFRVLLTLAIVFAIFNAPYFLKQANYYLNKPEPVAVETVAPEGQDTGPRAEPNTIWIESLGIKAPVIYMEEKSEDKFQEALRSGTVHYPGTAEPGQPGNAYIFGHSSDFVTSKGDYKTVFAYLPKLEVGGIISVTDKDGWLFRYKVDRKFVVSPSDTSVLAQDTTKRQLTLQTSYPIGTALRRYIVVSYLVQE